MRAGAEPFEMPLTAFYGIKDKKIRRPMLEDWSKFTRGPFKLIDIDGHHLWPLQPACKTQWLQQIVKGLQ